MLYILKRKNYVFITTKAKKQHIKIRREGGRGIYMFYTNKIYVVFFLHNNYFIQQQQKEEGEVKVLLKVVQGPV